MNAISAVTSRISDRNPTPSAVPAAQTAVPTPAAAAITLSPQAQKTLSLVQPQPTNVIWGSGPSR